MIRFTGNFTRLTAALSAGIVFCLASACGGSSSPTILPSSVSTTQPVAAQPTAAAAKPTVQASVTVVLTSVVATKPHATVSPDNPSASPSAAGAGIAGAVTATPPANAAGPSGTPVALAALINDKVPVTLDELNTEVARELDARKSLGDPPPADMKAFKDTVLESLIQGILIEQSAAIQGITVSDQEVESEIQADVQAAGGQDKWLAQIAADHMTEAEYRAGVKSALITMKMRDLVTSNVGTTAEQVHARHILVADEATAQQVLQQLKAGADFATLAAKYSLDVTTKQTGGDLGWFARGQLLQKSVEDAAFSLPINQYSAPVKSDLGYHIIETLEKVSNRPIDAATRARLAEQTFEAWYESVRKAAKVVKYI